MTIFSTRSQRTAAIAALGISCLLFTACSSNGTEPSTPASGSSAVDEAALEQSRAAVEAGWDGTDGPLPDSAPKPPATADVWLIACSLSAPGCAQPVLAMEEAGKELGWNMTVADAKFDFSYYPTILRQAIAANPDAIVVQAMDCPDIEQPLREARDAGIPVYSSTSFDCDDPKVGGESLFAGSTPYGTEKDMGEYLKSLGRLSADMLIDATDGQPRVVEVYQEDALYDYYVNTGFEERMNECSSCEFRRAEVVGADYGDGGVLQKTSAVLTDYPEANAAMAPIDALVTLGAGAAVQADGRALPFVAVGGAEPMVAEIAAGGPLTLGVGLPLDWLGWATIDGVNRLLNGEEDVNQGIGTQLFSADRNLPITPAFYDGNVDETGNAKVDYRAHYLEIWGVK